MVASLNVRHCPVCLREDTLFDVCEAKGYRIYGCGYCRAEHVHPMPTEGELKAYYDREQWFEGGEPGGYQNYEKQTGWSVDALRRILEQDYAGKAGLSILDVGCGYGAHLDAAAALGWKCFGTEISAHARGIAQKRLGGRAYITEEIGELIPHEFDVVLILDVIEHVANPYTLFYSLFSIGAITPKTRVIITTPNAGSHDAESDPAGWAYRHPPSHLVYYRKETFDFLLSKIGFDSIQIRGEHPRPSEATVEKTLADYAGLHVQAQGSNFTEFMRERYVPGTWSKIAEYEHLPRYALAKRFVQDKAVLDFGCGTGYGSAVLAGAAKSVMGLDIDAEAIAWAKSTHTSSGAEFYRCDNLGASLPSASFDVVTCFEMIEHVDLQTQHQTIEQVARLLRDDGIFVISTPNPQITSLYGANPYHLREMTREEFAELLGEHFPHLHILEQRVRDSVSFESTQAPGTPSFEVLRDQTGGRLVPLAYIAFCSRRPLPGITASVMFDDAHDVVHDFLDQEKKKNVLRFSAYRLGERVDRQSTMLRDVAKEIRRLGSNVGEVAMLPDDATDDEDVFRALLGLKTQMEAKGGLVQVDDQVRRLETVIKAKDERLQEVGHQLQGLNETLTEKQRALAEQEQMLARLATLEADYACKDSELAQLGREVHRLEAVVLAKDNQLAQVGEELNRLEVVVLAKDERLQDIGLQLQSAQALLAAREQELSLCVSDSAHYTDAPRADMIQEIEKLRAGLAELSPLPTRIQVLEQELALSAKHIEEQRDYYYAEVDKRDKLLTEAQERHDYLFAEVDKRDQLLNEVHVRHEQMKTELHSHTAALRTLKLTRWFRIRELLLHQPFGVRKLLLLAVTIGGGLVPLRWRSTLVPRLQRLFGLAPVVPDKAGGASGGAYKVKVPPSPAEDAPRVVHAIANFMTGGSSRLVIDLVEHLGGEYRQSVLTSFNPDPPAYEGVPIEECRFPSGIAPFVEYFERTRPDFVHVHYWGDCDEPWYAKVIDAARRLGLPVIENINTPIEPHRSEAVEKYVYVSDYVRSVFGDSDARHVTVYPGSDFQLFTRAQEEEAPDDCVGMVYRLERDKLSEDAIQPFIHIARLRPSTRILIVGGGSLLEPFQMAVKAAGVADRFEFTGYVPYEALPELYRRMSVFVAPIWKESFGQVAPFAMSMKVPVVGYNVGAIGEIIENLTLLAPPADAQALAEIVIRLLDAPEQRREIGKAQQKRAQQLFSLQAMIAHYAQIYGEMAMSARQEYS